MSEKKEEAASAPSRTPSSMKVRDFRKSVASLTADNFSQTLSDIEPFLLNDAGATMYAKSIRRITTQAKIVGVRVPEGYAKDAAATEKKRAKQDAFIKVKEEERLAVEAEAAEAAAAAAAAAEKAEAVEEAAEPVEAEAAEETAKEPVAEPVMA
jgi:hypothetical protein